MKTDYFIWTNRVVELFFLNNEKEEFINSFMDYQETGDMKHLCDAACLSIGSKSESKSRWPHVKDEYDLIAQCQRMNSEDKYMSHTKEEIEDMAGFEGTKSDLNGISIMGKDQ